MSRSSLLNHQLPRSPSLFPFNPAQSSSSNAHNPLKRPRSPPFQDDASMVSHAPELSPSEARKRSLLRDLYARSERVISRLFVDGKQVPLPEDSLVDSAFASNAKPDDQPPAAKPVIKRAKRAIDEDDYGDDDDDEDEDDTANQHEPSPSKRPRFENDLNSDTHASTTPSKSHPDRRDDPSAADHTKTSSEEVRKKLEQEKKAAEDAAKESFQTLFYTLENDRDAMLEQQKLDEIDRHLETEMSAQAAGPDGHGNTSGSLSQPGTLSSANLGASSLTLKHLIARIDEKRHMVKATDAQIKQLLNEVRKNRSKWASEDKVGQEELYEAAEKVLMELKAKADLAAPFLQKVNKRDAPDYYNIIKYPMDLGTMIKKLKQLQYSSKKQFCEDLELIWANCLKYNANPEHFLRKKAELMRKETARLTPLIPDIVVRDRAEVEAEERRLQHDFDDAEDSEDEPLMSTRGRKAPGKSAKKGGTTVRKAPQANDASSSTPAPDSKPSAAPNNALSLLKSEHLRSEAESLDGSQHGLSTPPPGAMTPIVGSAAPPSHADMSELEGLGPPGGGPHLGIPDDAYPEDEDYQAWKQITQKDRAHAAAERNRLFQGTHIIPDEFALLRTKAGMRRYLRLQKPKEDQPTSNNETEQAAKTTSEEEEDRPTGTTLAEGMDVEDDSLLPDYYDPLVAVPEVDQRLSWVEDPDGQIVDQKGECLRLIPAGRFVAPKGSLSSKMEANMRQMQETRKLVAKISIVKQMQLQAQTYQNQFQKYDPEPFHEADVGPLPVTDDGPVMAHGASRQALQRSIAKLFYHAGFEDFQPSALEAITDLASDYFTEAVRTLQLYTESPKIYDDAAADSTANVPVPVKPSATESSSQEQRCMRPRFSGEEALLQTLHQFGHDLDSLDFYVTDDFDRLASRLDGQHARTKDYLAEILRPALDPATVGTDGVGAFHDGSEQFVGGDFAEDLDEDFFGFRELGLDKEFGLETLNVPLHLLQSRVHNAYQPAANATNSGAGQLMTEPPIYSAVTIENVAQLIGIAQDFFRKRLEANDDEPLVEDDDLPVKQRYPKPRLPPTGKITSPRKRPVREQQMMARKKRRMEIEAEREREREAANAENGANGTTDGTLAGPIEPLESAQSSANIPNNQDLNEILTANQQPQQQEGGDTNMVNGESTAAIGTSIAETNGILQNGDLAEANGEALKDSEQLSGLKINMDPSTKLDPPSATNSLNIGDPEKKPAAPSSGVVNGEVEDVDQPQENADDAIGSKANSDADGDADADGATGGEKKPDNEEEGKENGEEKDGGKDQDEKKESNSEKKRDSESNDQEDQNGILSPESVPIAAH